MEDWKKSFEASKLPIAYIVFLGIVNLFGPSLRISGLLNLVILLLSVAIYLWAGYNAVDRFKLDRTGSARTGMITGLIANLINGTIAFIFVGLGGAEDIFTIGGMLEGIIVIVIVSVIGALVSTLIAVIGASIALRKKPQEKPIVNKPKKAGR